MDLPVPTWINLAIQIPIVLLFLYALVKFLDHTKALVTQFLEYLTDERVKTLKFIGEQADINREFLSAQREQMNSAIARLADEQKIRQLDMVKEVSTLTTMVDRTMDRLILFDAELKGRRDG